MFEFLNGILLCYVRILLVRSLSKKATIFPVLRNRVFAPLHWGDQAEWLDFLGIISLNLLDNISRIGDTSTREFEFAGKQRHSFFAAYWRDLIVC